MIQTIKHKKYYLGNSINPNQTNGELAEVLYHTIMFTATKGKSANFPALFLYGLRNFQFNWHLRKCLTIPRGWKIGSYPKPCPLLVWDDFAFDYSIEQVLFPFQDQRDYRSELCSTQGFPFEVCQQFIHIICIGASMASISCREYSRGSVQRINLKSVSSAKQSRENFLYINPAFCNAFSSMVS